MEMNRAIKASIFIICMVCTTEAGITKKAIVSLAPDVVPTNDLDLTGNCQDDIKAICTSVEVGNGAVADCLSKAIEESDHPLSDACREEVYQFKITRNTNINANVKLAMACKVDAEANCK